MIGSRNRYIEVKTAKETPDTIGGRTTVFSSAKKLWAKIRPLTGSRALEYGQLGTNKGYEIEVPYFSEIQITEKSIIIYSRRTLVIHSVIDAGEGNRTKIIIAFESASGNVFCDKYQAVYDAMTTPPSTDIAKAQDTMVKALIDGGVWDKLDFFCLFAQESNDGSEALVNWIRPGTFDATLSGAPTFTSLEGLTGDGSGYVDHNWNPSSDALNYALDDACFFCYCRTNKDEAKYDLGSWDSPNFAAAFLRSSGQTLAYVNSSNAAFVPSGVTDSRGFYIFQRAAAGSQQIYKNGTLIRNESDASTALPDDNFKSLGAGSSRATKQLSAVGAGSALDADERDALQDAIETYMDSNSKGVI